MVRVERHQVGECGLNTAVSTPASFLCTLAIPCLPSAAISVCPSASFLIHVSPYAILELSADEGNGGGGTTHEGDVCRCGVYPLNGSSR